MAESSGVHVRCAGEYVRPDLSLSLSGGDSYERLVRGAAFHKHRFDGCNDGASVDLELVPEFYNVHDSHAVAVDYDGHRIGYLPASDADAVHDLIVAANRRGHAVWTTGVLTKYEFDEGVVQFVPRLTLPTRQRFRDIATSLGLADEVARVLDQFDEDTRWMIITRRSDLDPDLRKRLHNVSHLAPSFTWPVDRTRGRFPGALEDYLLDAYYAERDERRWRKQSETQARKEAQAREKAERTAAREAAAAAAREREHGDVRDAVEAGLSLRETAELLGIAESKVSSIKRTLGLSAPPTWATDQRSERLERCRNAVALQAEGLTRRQISERLHVQHDTVAGLLRDGRFYADPASDIDRLGLAISASEGRDRGWTKAEFRAELRLSGAKAQESWKDADCLRLLGHLQGR